MEDQKQINVNVEAKNEETTFRFIGLSSDNQKLPKKEPVVIDVTGVPGNIYEFLDKRLDKGQFKQEECHIIVNRENMEIKLIINETDAYNRSTISGKLSVHPRFKEFQINSSYAWQPLELGQFFKMNRAFFEDTKAHENLVDLLSNFEADIQNRLEKKQANNGSSRT
jgi:hypothetical protein